MKTKMTKEQKDREKAITRKKKMIVEPGVSFGLLIQLREDGSIEISGGSKREEGHRRHEYIGLLEMAKNDILNDR